MGPAAAARNLDPHRHHHIIGYAQKAVGLSAPEWACQGADEVGRIERTLFTLDWIKNPDLRRRAHLGLNKGEARNALARAVYFCRLGEVRDRRLHSRAVGATCAARRRYRFENQFFRASGLNLLVSAIILWNTKYLEVAYTELRRQGGTISDDLLRHVAPLGWSTSG